MKKLLIILLILPLLPAKSQIRELTPSDIVSLAFSLEEENKFDENAEAAQMIYARLNGDFDYEDLSPEEQNILSNFDETMMSYWDIIGEGCSWYCGGGPYEVTASSCLQAQGENSYEPANAHDLSYKYAWVEGAEGYGIGEYLLYTFAANAPRITEIKVVNGYVKSQAAWENNSRVKKLKVYIDDKPYAILKLEDICGTQTFEVEPIGNSNRNDWEAMEALPDWTLKFEIMEVYRGKKYADVAITEIYFDGLDVHCLAPGTPILMADGTTRAIRSLKPGDRVLSFDAKSGSLTPAEIETVAYAVHCPVVTYTFESGRTITATPDHPFLVEKKGWSSCEPKKTKQYEGYKKVKKIEVGDIFAGAKGNDRLEKIEYINESTETYTISGLKGGDNFIANGLVVGIEKLE
ncbi:MAG: hypothetical protein JW801_03800 [Bacteroidales bacterium]|nr:hypothetical protein [Bacteroidales bacterium]